MQWTKKGGERLRERELNEVGKESASAVTIFIIKRPAKNLSQNIKQNPS